MAHQYIVEMLDEKTGVLRLTPTGDTDPILVPGLAPSAAIDTTDASNITKGTLPENVGIFTNILDAKNQSGPVDAVLRASLAFTGMYLISVDVKITQAASGGHKPASIIGPASANYVCADTNLASSIMIAFNDGAGNIVKTNSGNAVNDSLTGSQVVCALAGSQVSINIGYTSTGTVPMRYVCHVKAVLLGIVP